MYRVLNCILCLSLFKCLATAGAKKRYQMCYTKRNVASMLTVRYQPDPPRPWSHFMAPNLKNSLHIDYRQT